MDPILESAIAAPPLDLSDEAAVARVLEGDRSAFVVLLRRYNQRLYRVTRAILGDDAEAQDAMQQAYLSAYRSLPGFAWHSSFATWLTRIARNEALARVRGRRRRAEVDLDDGSEASLAARNAERDSPEENASAHQMAALVEHAIETLPEIYREVFVLREVQGLDTAESAACLGVTEDLVKVRLHRARDRIRQSIGDRVDSSASVAFPFLGERCDRMVLDVMEAIDELET